MAFDDFEKELFDDLEGYQSNMDLDQEWQELEERLPKKKKRRGIFFWLFSGVSMMTLLVIVLFFYNKNKGLDTNEGLTIEKQNIENKNDQLNLKQPVSETESNLATTKHKSFNHKLTTPVLSEKKSLQQSNYKIESSNYTITQKLETSKISFSQNTPNWNDGKKQKSDNYSPNTDVLKPVVKNSGVGLSKKSKGKVSISLIPSLDFELLSKTPELDFSDSLFLKKKIIPPPSPQTNWGIALGGTYGLNQFKRISSFDVSNQLDFIAQLESPVDYVGVNFKFYRKLNNHFSIFSGLVMSQHTNLFELGDKFEVERENESTLIEQHYLLSGSIQDINGQGKESLDVNIQSKLWQSYQSIAIPIGISFCTSTAKRWSLQNDLALLWSPIQFIKGRKIIRTDSDYYVFDNNTYSKLKFASVSNQLSLNWKIKEHLFLQGTIDMGLDLGTRLNPEFLYDLRFSYVGIGLGVKFLF